jgi:CheY-like chemotaxis protein
MILLIEEDATRRTSFAETLRSYGYEVLEASDGPEALALTTKHQPVIKVIIADIGLPKANKVAFTEILRVLLPNVPIIGVSTRRSTTGGEKPIPPATLVSVVEQFLGPRQTR